MTSLGPAPFSVTEDDLKGKYGRALTRMIEDDLEGDVETERLTQVAMALRNIMYWQSKQYVIPKYDAANRAVEFIQATDKTGKVRFASVYNIFESDGAKFIGAVSPRSPNAKALPDDDESEDNVSLAKDVDGALRVLRRKWDTDRRQKEMAYHAWTTGPIFGMTSYVADGHRYGWTEEPVIEIEDVNSGMGQTIPTPKVTGTKRYPKGDVELTLASVLYVTIPYKCKELKDADWLRYEYMEHKSLLKALYSEQLSKENIDEFDREETRSDSQSKATQAQYQESSPSGYKSDWDKNRWHYSRYWVRPTMYSLIGGQVKSEDGEKSRKLSEVIEEQFPDGLRITLVNGKVVDVMHERLDAIWSVCKTGKGERILSEPWGNNLIPIQDDINDFVNMAREIILRSIPKTLIDSSLIDRNSIENNDPEIAEVILTKVQAGMNIGNMMAPFPMARMPDQLIPFAQFLRGASREIGGVTEALSGGGTPSPTYRGEKQRRDQSMMQFAPFFDETQAFWERAYTNGLRQWAKYGSGTEKAPKDASGPAQTIDIASLALDGWHIEAEEGLPMSHTEELDRLMYLMGAEVSPEIADKMELFSPSNSQQLYKMLGLRGFKSTVEDSLEKAHKDIQKLLLEPPVQGVDPETGQPMDQPSIPPDEFEDDPVVFAGIYRDWCLVSQGDREKNPQGYANVRARGMMYQKKADMQAQQAAMAQAGGPPPGPGGPPPPDTGAPPPPTNGGAAPEGPPPPETFQTQPSPPANLPPGGNETSAVLRNGAGQPTAVESSGDQGNKIHVIHRDANGRIALIETKGN